MSDRELNGVEKDIIKRMGLDPAAVKGNVLDFYTRMGGMESDNNEDAANSVSSAKGVYQFLNKNRGKDGNANTSFEVGLSRTARAYKRAGEEVPAWVETAMQSGDPRTLTREQADTLLISDLVYGRKPVSDPMSKYFVEGQNNPANIHNVYKHHHTDVTNTAEQGNVIGRMNKWFGEAK
jgi:hypothetical protein